MPIRKIPLRTGYIYHIFNRGINHAPIFYSKRDYQRFTNLISYYRWGDNPVKYSRFQTLSDEIKNEIRQNSKEKLVSFISNCLIPNHFHFVLRQEKENGISYFVNRFLAAYTKFFNTKYKRSGPLFENRFKAVLVETDEQLIHLVRYIHLNPYSSGVVKSLRGLLSYPWSSLQEYLDPQVIGICDEKEMVLKLFKDDRETFKKFTLDQAEYQKRLDKIKHLIQE
ncbi:MAG: hypothetical protein CH104c_0372 [Candidatus Woesebacteria bacterium]|jgi:putative transposase|nr:MAG: hypothetical protein CH104c_0372 [Candidatus Woesebacteria bacterium]